MNVFRGLKKSQSGPNLTFSERISLGRRSKRGEKGRSSGLESPLPPRPPSRGASVKGPRIIENIPENRVHDVRNENLHIRGEVVIKLKV